MRIWCLVLSLALLTPSPAFAGPSAPPAASSKTKSEADTLVERAAVALNAQDAPGARKLMEQAAATGDPEAMNGLAVYMAMGVGAPADPKGAQALQEKAHKAGSHGAALNMGMRLLQDPSPEQRRRGVALLEEAHADPHLAGIAAGELAQAYIFGDGVDRDVARGVALLDEADAAGVDDAQVLFLLGRTYGSGLGGRARDPARSYRYFLRSAERGNSHAMRYAGLALLNGDGVPADPAAAVAWFRKGAEAGDKLAQIDLAVSLALGEGGLEKNPAEARVWYRKAADQGSAHAMRALGAMWMTGEGGAVDHGQGLAFLQMAVEAGDKEAQTLLDRFQSQATGIERVEAEGLKAAWRKAHPGVEVR